MRIIPFFIVILLVATSLIGCAVPATSTPQPTSTPMAPLVSIDAVKANPASFQDKYIRMQGHGVMMATFPLCPGYTGLDTRTIFVDAKGLSITAVVKWKPPESSRLYDRDKLRVFEGYIRIFSGEIGCPGSTRVDTFPYFEIVGAE